MAASEGKRKAIKQKTSRSKMLVISFGKTVLLQGGSITYEKGKAATSETVHYSGESALAALPTYAQLWEAAKANFISNLVPFVDNKLERCLYFATSERVDVQKSKKQNARAKMRNIAVRISDNGLHPATVHGLENAPFQAGQKILIIVGLTRLEDIQALGSGGSTINRHTMLLGAATFLNGAGETFTRTDKMSDEAEVFAVFKFSGSNGRKKFENLKMLVAAGLAVVMADESISQAIVMQDALRL